MPTWSDGIDLGGRSFLPLTRVPTAADGKVNDSGVLLTTGVVYGPKQADGSWPNTGYSLKGTSGTDANLPADISANSLTLSPVSGDSSPVQLHIINAGNSPVFTVDDNGNTSVAGTFAVTGVATAQTLNAGAVSASSANVTGDTFCQGKLTVNGKTQLATLEVQSLGLDGDSVFSGNVTVNGATTLVSASIDQLAANTVAVNKTLTVTQKSTLQNVQAAQLQVGTGPAPGSAQIVGTFAVTGPTTLADLQAGNIAATSLTTTGNASVGGALQAATSVAAETLALTPAQGSTAPAIAVSAQGGSTVFSCDPAGNVYLAGTLNVAGAQTDGALNAGALTATSFINTGNTHLEGTLLVDKATTLGSTATQDLSATTGAFSGTLSAGGKSTLADVAAQNTSVATLTSTGNASVAGALAVTGNTTLGSLSAGAITASSAEVNNAIVDATLIVRGGSNLQGVSAQGVSTTTLNASGSISAGGNVAATGDLSGRNLLLASTSAKPFRITDTSNNELASIDNAGDMVIAGALTVQGSGANGATNAGALTVSSFKDTGNAQIGGNLAVTGTASTGDLTAGKISGTSLTTTNGATIGATSSVAGDLLVAGTVGAGAVTAGSVRTNGAAVVKDANGNGGNFSVDVKASIGKVVSGENYTGYSQVNGNELVTGTLQVNSGTQLGALTVTGGTTLASLTAAGASLSSLNVSGNAQVIGTGSFGGALTVGSTIGASGLISAPALTITLPASNGATTPLLVQDNSNNALFSVDQSGNVALKGTLTVAGAQTNTTTNAGALQCTSLVDSGNAQIQGTLQVQGATTLAGTTTGALSASSATVSGDTSLQKLTAGASTVASLNATGAAQVGNTLQVSGNTTLSATSTGNLTAASFTSSGSGSVVGSFQVQGASTLAALTAAAITASSLSTSGNAQVGGTLNAVGAATFSSTLGVTGAATLSSTLSVSGQTQTAALVVRLPASGAAATPIQLVNNSNTTLMSVDSSGNAVFAGSVTGSNVGGNTQTGALQATSISDSGTLSVQGNSTLAAVTATSINASSLATTGAVTVGTTLGVSGQSTLAAVSASSLSTSGAVSIGSTLGVTGAATLAALSATTVQASGAVSLGSTLAVTGTSTLAGVTAGAITCTGLTASGGGSFTGLISAQAVSITLPASNPAATPIVLKSNGGTTLLSVDTSGNLIVGGTLSVTGATTLAALTASSASVTNNASVGGTLSVTGATTAAALTSSGTVQAKNLVLTSGGGGSLTFADGTSMTTAATGSGGQPAATVFLQGNGPPNSSTAPNVITGNFYYDNANSVLYGPSTSNSYTGLTQVTNVVGPPGPQGPTTSYRNSVRGTLWLYAATTANTAYPIAAVICGASMSANPTAYNIPLVEPMFAAGSFTALTVFTTANVSGTWTVNIVKNGTTVYTATNILTSNGSGNGATAVKILPTSGLTFAANDVVSLTASSSSGTANQNLGVNLFYTTNS